MEFIPEEETTQKLNISHLKIMASNTTSLLMRNNGTIQKNKQNFSDIYFRLQKQYIPPSQ